MTVTYTFQPFCGALHQMESGRSVLRQERVDRARAAAEKYFGWLSRHLHLVWPLAPGGRQRRLRAVCLRYRAKRRRSRACKLCMFAAISDWDALTVPPCFTVQDALRLAGAYAECTILRVLLKPLLVGPPR
jgi:hypothetical protein